jgi:hypothetical protein
MMLCRCAEWWQDRRHLPIHRIPLDPECLHRAVDILQRQEANIVQARLQLACDSIMNVARQDDSIWRSLGFETGRHIHAIAVQIMSVDDEIAEVKADPENDPGVFRLAAVEFDHCGLKFDGSPHGVYGTAEFRQSPVAYELHEAAAVPGQCRLESSSVVRLQTGKRADFVLAHKPRIADRVDGQNRRQFAPFSLHVRFLKGSAMEPYWAVAGGATTTTRPWPIRDREGRRVSPELLAVTADRSGYNLRRWIPFPLTRRCRA